MFLNLRAGRLKRDTVYIQNDRIAQDHRRPLPLFSHDRTRAWKVGKYRVDQVETRRVVPIKVF